MAKKIFTPKQSLLKGYMKQPVSRNEINLFKNKLRVFFSHVNSNESEEFNKNLIMQFLNQTFYAQQGCMVNTYERTDLAIYERNSAGEEKPVVLFEFKGPGRPDMISKEDFRQKSIYELVLYYLREEVRNKNHDIKYLIVTDCFQFFIFEKKVFYELFAKNKKLVGEVMSADTEKGDKTEYIYNNYIAPVIEKVEDKMVCTYLNLQDFRGDVREGNETITQKFIAAYKLLSPTHLLRLPFSSDHNTLNSKFYRELLYIMGLEEVTEDKKKVIKRLKNGQQHYSLIEQTFSRLGDYDDIRDDKQRFDIAIGLVLLWVNRVLFLKLLESQLVAFNDSTDYRFMNIDMISDYDALNDLFREVLAKPYQDRDGYIREAFAKVPYLNSSLFEVAPLEQKYFSISGLRLGKVEIFSHSVLTDGNGRKLTGTISEIEYLFRFLDAFDFGETAREDSMVSEESRTIIDASVLGLIFEKINGYKDGSIFTPGYITQYMCGHTIRQAVLDKFNKEKSWQCSDFDELKDHINTFSRDERTEANTIINSLKICDISVGSGHFLVSALNELIAIKSELGILQDHSEKPKPINSYDITIENDELVIKDEDGDSFFYNPRDKESQRIQETLFEEKKTIIENCLFGVDLNPKSVEICQLRLWIELLKNAYYYNSDEDGRVLRTLPNIDINIQCGDSLASVMPVCIGQKISSIKGISKLITEYKGLVKEYINCHSKKVKKEIREKISVIKRKLSPPIEQDFFTPELNERQRKERKVLGHALEWMIEFPEAIDGEGAFKGFDIIIGNPPYINLQGMADESFVYSHMKRRNEEGFQDKTYKTLVPRADIYALFVERAMQLLRKDGYLSFIMPNKWMKVIYGRPLRELFLEQDLTDIVDFGDNQVFGDATTYTCIISLRKRPSTKQLHVANINEINEETLAADVDEKSETYDLGGFNDGIWFTSSLENHKRIITIQRDKQFSTLNDFVGGESYRGILTGLSKAFLISQSVYDSLIASDSKSGDILRPFLIGNGLVAYKNPKISKYIVFVPKGFTRLGMGISEEETLPEEHEAWEWFSSCYPAVANWLLPFKPQAQKRTDKGDYWWELRACAYYEKFSEPKIMYQAFQTKPCFIYEATSIFCNNSMFFFPVLDQRLLSLLNSSTGWWLISEFCPRIQNGYQLIWDNFSQIPVPKELPQELDSLAKEIEAAVSEGDTEKMKKLRARIGNIVMGLYSS